MSDITATATATPITATASSSSSVSAAVSSTTVSTSAGGGVGPRGPAGQSAALSWFLAGPPTDVSVVGGVSDATISWIPPAIYIQTPVTDYRIQYSSDSGDSWTTFSHSASTDTTAIVTGLTSGTSYIFRVAAITDVGPGAYSDPVEATIGSFTDPFFGNVSLLLHMDGAAQSFVDSSSAPKTVLAFGNAAQSATRSRFGGISAYFDGDGSYLTSPPNSAFSLPADFTIEFWVFFAYIPNSYAGEYGAAIVNCYSGGVSPDAGWQVRINGTSLGEYTTINLFTGVTNLDFPYSFSQNQWHHVAISRVSSTIRAYANGTQAGSRVSNSDAFTPSSGNSLSIGQLALESVYLFELRGYIDDLRITKGTGRYTGSTITVPLAAFPNA